MILYLGDGAGDDDPVRAVLTGRATDDADVVQALEAIKASGAVEDAAAVAGGYAAQARAALDRVRPSPSRELVAAFIHQATERTR